MSMVELRKVITCASRVAKGKVPSCVLHGPSAVMRFGPIEELAKEMGQVSYSLICSQIDGSRGARRGVANALFVQLSQKELPDSRRGNLTCARRRYSPKSGGVAR